jgi:hypothetical protein
VISRSSMLGTPGFTPRGLVDPIEHRMVQTEPIVEVLDREQRVHIVLPLGHHLLMNKTWYGIPGWSMRRTTRMVPL